MVRRIIRICCPLLLALSFLLPIIATSTVNAASGRYELRPYVDQHVGADFPTVDPDYIYNQLFYMVTHYQHREAGYDNNLPVSVNGHDEFATYWAQEMARNLQGFGPQVKPRFFPGAGLGRTPGRCACLQRRGERTGSRSS